MTRVLIVDDKQDNLYYLRVLLTGQGFAVDSAPDGAAALATARESRPDVVISDLLMPVMDGYALMRHWKDDASLRHVPFIVYTSTYTDARDERFAASLGADAFILKPAEPEELLARLGEVLARAAVARPTLPANPRGDEGVLKLYNETLIRKLEEKTLQLEETNRALQRDISKREIVESALRESEQRFRQIAGSIKEVFWLTDSEKNEMLYVSPAYEQVWGRKGDALQASPDDWLNAVHAEDRERVVEATRMRQRRGDYAEEYRIVRPDGSIRWIRERAFPVTDALGAVYRIAGVAEDVTEERRAAIELSVTMRALKMHSSCSEALIRAANEQSLLDRICRIAVEVGGYRIALVAFALEKEGKPIAVTAHAGDMPNFLSEKRISWAADRSDGQGGAGRAIRTGETVVIGMLPEEPSLSSMAPEIRAAGLRRAVYLPLNDGTRVFGAFILYSSDSGEASEDELTLLRELAGDLAFGICAIRARVERERADAALLASLHEKEALLKEVHHRVKNNLQVIRSLLRLESSRIDHDTTKGVLQNMQNRIQSMALLHDTLYRSGNFAQVDLATYLAQLTGQLIRSLAPAPSQVELRLDLVSGALNLEQAIPCGLIVNELVTNSLKHAFPAGRSGTVSIDLHPVGDGALRLRVRDDGVGLPPDLEARVGRSLGLQLVSDLAKQLGGRLEMGPDSLFQVTFKPGQAATALPSASTR